MSYISPTSVLHESHGVRSRKPATATTREALQRDNSSLQERGDISATSQSTLTTQPAQDRTSTAGHRFLNRQTGLISRASRRRMAHSRNWNPHPSMDPLLAQLSKNLEELSLSEAKMPVADFPEESWTGRKFVFDCTTSASSDGEEDSATFGPKFSHQNPTQAMSSFNQTGWVSSSGADVYPSSEATKTEIKRAENGTGNDFKTPMEEVWKFYHSEAIAARPDTPVKHAPQAKSAAYQYTTRHQPSLSSRSGSISDDNKKEERRGCETLYPNPWEQRTGSVRPRRPCFHSRTPSSSIESIFDATERTSQGAFTPPLMEMPQCTSHGHDTPVSSFDEIEASDAVERLSQPCEPLLRMTSLTTTNTDCSDKSNSPDPTSRSDDEVVQDTSSQTTEASFSGSDSEMSFMYSENCPQNVTSIYGRNSDAICAGLVSLLLNTYIERAANSPQDGDSDRGASSAKDSTQAIRPTSTSSSSSTDIAPQVGHGKRKKDDGDEGNGSPRSRRPRFDEISDLDPEIRILACPYAKFDLRRYSERNALEKHYRGCTSCYLRDIPRLKQHLYRVHRRPEHHCQSCFTEFDTADAVNQHMRQRPPCEVAECPFAEKMSTDQLKAIKRRKMGKDRITAWYDIFDILFPEAQLPTDPFVDSECSEGAMSQFLNFLEEEAPSQISATVGVRLYGAEWNEGLQQFTDQVVEECVSAFLQRMRAQFQGLSELDEPLPWL